MNDWRINHDWAMGRPDIVQLELSGHSDTEAICRPDPDFDTPIYVKVDYLRTLSITEIDALLEKWATPERDCESTETPPE